MTCTFPLVGEFAVSLSIVVCLIVLAAVAYSAVAKRYLRHSSRTEPERNQKSIFHVADEWQLSEHGNAMRLYHGKRLTVFERDGGWKFCIADADEDDDPYFSDPYETEDAAKYEVMALLDGRPSEHKTMREAYAESRDAQMVERLAECSTSVTNLFGLISETINAPDVNITKLRPLEQKLITVQKTLSRLDEHFRMRDDAQSLGSAEGLLSQSQDMSRQVTSKIEWLRATPKALRNQPSADQTGRSLE